MNAKTNSSKSFDTLIWLVVAALLVGSFVANYVYAGLPVTVRIIGWLVMTCVMLGIAFQTNVGKSAWAFLQDAKIELQKVVWPTRDETVKTTLMVIVVVVIMACILWGIDTVLLKFVSLLTGQSG